MFECVDEVDVRIGGVGDNENSQQLMGNSYNLCTFQKIKCHNK